MTDQTSIEQKCLERALQRDESAIGQLMEMHRDRLKNVVRLRLNPKLQGRVDASDVVQDALFDASRRLEEYAADPQLPFYLWLRHLAGLKLLETHRKHLGTGKRNAANEVSLTHRIPEASSILLAEQIADRLTSPSQSVLRDELRSQVQQALNMMETDDREVLVLRHFEQLSTAESAQVLGISKSVAGERYLRAIKRLRSVLQQFPGIRDLTF